MAALFTVNQVINSTTIRVNPGWKWNNVEGSLVKIKGIKDSPNYNTLTVHRLNSLLIGKPVELKNASQTIALHDGTAVFCSVYLNEIDISQYFPEVKSV